MNKGGNDHFDVICLGRAGVDLYADQIGSRLEDVSSFSKYIGVKHGIAVTNGTAALETALFAIGISKGDEIIMPSFTIISCAVAAIRFGAIPIFVDIEPETWNMDPEKIECIGAF